ncbi:LysM peptidoglycan-binding domain-containing protein [Phaeodactylibacter luteus]|uniref:LysM peptidoglycan-binding domain-containing protein n=2 Tax=Phaeodactylibacter luteus TaxID=1564516 RepID=A0A5C6RMN0_9BACT|nr:LysM peptidoglycan-binding domain-containing protein [Phaeodactylibacter luteus]
MQNPLLMKFPWTIVAVLAVNSLSATPKTETPASVEHATFNSRWSASIESEVKERIMRLNIPFKVRYDEEVSSTIKEYVTNGYRDTELMLGRTSAYFPIFEHYLNVYGLPKELRYLPIVETGLNIKAYSGAGAAGLWQFIAPSARMYGLEVNHTVDERFDAYRATEAAVSMLARLHSHYKDWSLVLAAYNCGPARVNAAIREAGCRDFYTVANYLPQETQHYIPRFIAAAYITNYHKHHGISPRYKGAFGKPLRGVKLFESYTIGEVAHASGVPVEVLRQLNPAYRRSIIPANERGHYLLLPASGLRGLKGLVSARSGRFDHGHRLLYPNAFELAYVVKPGESIEEIASRYNCTVQEIAAWNQLSEEEVFVNQEVTLYVAELIAPIKP